MEEAQVWDVLKDFEVNGDATIWGATLKLTRNTYITRVVAV